MSEKKEQPKKEQASGKKKPTSRKQTRSALQVWGRRLTVALLSLIFLMVFGGAVMVMLAYYHFSQELPTIDTLRNYRPKTVTFFYSDDGRVIGEYSHERRIIVPLEKIPPHVQQAFIAAEDANFYRHQGIDLASIARAFVKNVEAGRVVQGGSTITQQVTKYFLLTPQKTYTRKIREAILAYRIENNLSKDEILFLYLNEIYLGHGAHGVESAAELYFNKQVDQLSIAEAALIAGLTQAPSRYSPFSRPDAARRRQEYTLNQMAENGYITEQQARQALDEKLVFHDRSNPNLQLTPYFTEEVRRQLVERYGEDTVYNDGLKVYTTVNIEMQAAAREAVRRGLLEFAKRRPYRGPIKQLAPGEVLEFLAAQNDQLASEPMTRERVIQAVAVEVNAKSRDLKVKVGSIDGIVHTKDLNWALARGNALDKLIAVNDVILVKAMEFEKETGLWRFSLEQEAEVQSALLSVDTATGAVKAMIGGKDFQKSQFNRAVQATRQPGSAFKPIIYTAAMDNGFTPGSIIIDSPSFMTISPTTGAGSPATTRPNFTDRPICSPGWSTPEMWWPLNFWTKSASTP